MSGGTVVQVRRFDHVGLTVRDLAAATAFFRQLGLEPEGPSAVIEGEFIDTVIGMDGAKAEVVMLRIPGAETRLELSAFLTPRIDDEQPSLPANVPGLRNVCFEVDDLRATVDRLGAAGHGLVGGVGEWQGAYLMAYVRGPDGIVVSIAESIG